MENKSNQGQTDTNCCTVNSGTRVVLTCSGASNLGQVANAMSIRLQHCGMAQMSCLAAIAADLPKFKNSVKKADEVLLIDGCNIACGQKVLEKAGINQYRYFVASDLLPELKKEHRYDQIETEVNNLWPSFIELL